MDKVSKYNFFTPYGERVIYYNGISRHIFSLTQAEHEKMVKLFEDPISFEIHYNSVYKQFKEWGFFVDEAIDELDILRYRNRHEVYSDRNYRLFINPTLDCNFSCWYCYQEHPKGYMSQEVLRRIKKYIVYLIKEVNIRSLNLSWFGGEPLLYFDEVVYPLSKYAQKRCAEAKIPFYNTATTNASKITPQMVDKMAEIGMSAFQITIDGDEKRHNKVRNSNGEPSFHAILENINLLCEKLKQVGITLRVNYDNETLAESDLAAVFKNIPEKHRSKIKVDFQRVWQTHAAVSAKKGENEERKALYKQCMELGFASNGVSYYNLSNKYHKCYADRKYYAEINYDGKVYRCTARGYEDKYVLGELTKEGRIQWNETKVARLIGKSTFENRMCLPCKYLPMCMGPCSQKLSEVAEGNLESICFLRTTEIKPETAIIDYYLTKMREMKAEAVKP